MTGIWRKDQGFGRETKIQATHSLESISAFLYVNHEIKYVVNTAEYIFMEQQTAYNVILGGTPKLFCTEK